jgi:hypothetical protein
VESEYFSELAPHRSCWRGDYGGSQNVRDDSLGQAEEVKAVLSEIVILGHMKSH